MTVRVLLPAHLRALARVDGEIRVTVEKATLREVLDGIEAVYPMLSGTIRDHQTRERRAFLRFFACQQDLSFDSPESVLPVKVVRGEEPLLIIGAVAGG